MDREILFLDMIENSTLEVINQLEKSNKAVEDLSDEQQKDLFINIPLKYLVEENMIKMEEQIELFHQDSLSDVNHNLKVLEETWGKAFAYYAFFLNTYVQLSDSFVNLIEKHGIYSEEDKFTLTALRYLNGRAIQISNGILVSLRNGYPDDGYSRLRTLYEILITVSFISKHGGDVAKKYISFWDSSYSWCRPVLKGKRIFLRDLENNCYLEKVFIDEWKTEHKKMHKVIHAAAEGTFNRVGGYMKKEIPIGSTNVGIDIVAVNCIRLMNTIYHQYTMCLYPLEDLSATNLIMLYLRTLSGITEKMTITFDELHKLNFSEHS